VYMCVYGICVYMMHVCVYGVCVCVYGVCVCACVRACVRACMRVCACVLEWLEVVRYIFLPFTYFQSVLSDEWYMVDG